MTSSSPAPEQSERYHGLDALRAIALMLGVVAHAATPFIPYVERSGWLIYDVSRSATFYVLFGLIHNFRLDIYFLIAGFFAHAVWLKVGTRNFLRDRARRILQPLLLGMLTLLPLVFGAMSAASAKLGLPPLAGRGLGINFAHMWFLWLLCWLYPLTFLGRRLVLAISRDPDRLRARVDSVVRWTMVSYAGVLLLALPRTLAMTPMNHHAIWSGIRNTDTVAFPHTAALLAYGCAFVFGWLVQRQHGLLHRLAPRWPAYLVAWVVLLVVCMRLSMLRLPPGTSQPLWLGFATAAAYSCAAWCGILGTLGAFTRLCTAPSAWRRYLADASYWVYLFHLPVVLWTEVAIMQAPFNCYLKFAVLMLVGLVVPLLTYHYWVRSTWIGRLLSGRRYVRTPLLLALSEPAVPMRRRTST